jgi:CHASE3 domain sensor protein
MLINESWEHTDSIKTSQLREQEQKMMKQAQEVERLQKNLKISSTVGGSVIGVVIVAAVLSLCLK